MKASEEPGLGIEPNFEVLKLIAEYSDKHTQTQLKQT